MEQSKKRPARPIGQPADRSDPPEGRESEDIASTDVLAEHKNPTTLPEFTPVPRQRMRKGGWSAERQREFIAELADCGSVRAACRRLGVAEHHIYKLRRHPEGESFRKAWEAALDIGIARIEDIAMDRALHGVEVPVYHAGQLVGSRTVYNDRLLMFMLRNRAPDRFSTATDGAQGKRPDAIGKMEMERLKKQWRREWEDERRVTLENEDQVLEEIDAKLDLMSQRHLDQMSPRTRALWDAYEASQEEDDENSYNPWSDPEHAFGKQTARVREGRTRR